MKKPFGFVHDINLIYFRFHTADWFYPNPGYSKEMIERAGWQFDGQFFYKK